MALKEQTAALKAKKLARANQESVLTTLTSKARRRLERMVGNFHRTFELPPPVLTWQGAEGYEISVMDNTDVMNMLPTYIGNFMHKKKNNAWKGVKSGFNAVKEAALGSYLPGLERALYNIVPGGEGAGGKGGGGLSHSLFGHAAIMALKGGGATEKRLPYITTTNLFKFISTFMADYGTYERNIDKGKGGWGEAGKGLKGDKRVLAEELPNSFQSRR